MKHKVIAMWPFSLCVLFMLLLTTPFLNSCARKVAPLEPDVGVTEEEVRQFEQERATRRKGMIEEEALREGGVPAAEYTADWEIQRIEFQNEDIYFDFDSAVLTEEAQEILRRKGSSLLDNPSVEVIIEGHCDERGTEEYNLALGERRAQSAKSFLISMGLETSRIATISYGEEKPVDSGHNEEAWAKNRRAHFVIAR